MFVYSLYSVFCGKGKELSDRLIQSLKKRMQLAVQTFTQYLYKTTDGHHQRRPSVDFGWCLFTLPEQNGPHP